MLSTQIFLPLYSYNRICMSPEKVPSKSGCFILTIFLSYWKVPLRNGYKTEWNWFGLFVCNELIYLIDIFNYYLHINVSCDRRAHMPHWYIVTENRLGFTIFVFISFIILPTFSIYQKYFISSIICLFWWINRQSRLKSKFLEISEHLLQL